MSQQAKTAPPNLLVRQVQKYPILSFILFTFTYTYLFGGMYNTWYNGLQLNASPMMESYLPRVFFVLGPMFGALTVTFLLEGRTGAGNHLKKLIPQKKDMIWYILFPLIAGAVTCCSYLLGGLPLHELITVMSSNWHLLLLHFTIQTLVIGIGEETGWRGWLLPQLYQRYSLLKTMLLITVCWILWHFPILFQGADLVFPWLMLAAAASLILACVWFRFRGNIFMVAVAHASINATQFFLENQLYEDFRLIVMNSWKINGFLYLGIGILFIFLLKKQHQKKLLSLQNRSDA